MLVQDIMTKAVVAIGPEMPIRDVNALMEQRNIRHFPILEAVGESGAEADGEFAKSVKDATSKRVKDDTSEPVRDDTPDKLVRDDTPDKLVGIVSDRDLRLVGSQHPAAPPGVTFKDPVRRVMASPVVTAHPSDPIEEAAKLLRERKIGAMPVMEGERLVGIVTAIDFLDALVGMTGVERGSSRLEVELSPDPEDLSRLVAQVAAAGHSVSSVMTAKLEPDARVVVLRVGTIDVRGLAERLTGEGFGVLWPVEK